MMPGTIWCLGMYGSASTWLFNVVRLLHTCLGTAEPRVHFFGDAGDFGGFDRPEIVDLVKSHEIADEATILELAKRARKIFITVRDPRDAVTSLLLARSHSFARALHYVEQSAKLCAAMRADRRALLLRYETGFFAAPPTVALIAAHLDMAVAAADAEAIFAANSRAAVEKHIASMAGRPGVLRDEVSGDLLDPQTQWHTHHAGRRGETGRWREVLTPEQIREIESRIPLFMSPAT
jgi:hypothetical protein